MMKFQRTIHPPPQSDEQLGKCRHFLHHMNFIAVSSTRQRGGRLPGRRLLRSHRHEAPNSGAAEERPQLGETQENKRFLFHSHLQVRRCGRCWTHRKSSALIVIINQRATRTGKKQTFIILFFFKKNFYACDGWTNV